MLDIYFPYIPIFGTKLLISYKEGRLGSARMSSSLISFSFFMSFFSPQPFDPDFSFPYGICSNIIFQHKIFGVQVGLIRKIVKS